MARTNIRFKTAYNRLLADLQHAEPEEMLPSEICISQKLGVSRTTTRSILRELDGRGVIAWNGRSKALRRKPGPLDSFSATELTTDREKLDRRFLEWVLRSDVAPETPLNIKELASRFAVTPGSLNAFLTDFSRFGLVERQGAKGWVLRGFTVDYATELFDFRVTIELDAARRVAGLPDDDPFWKTLEGLERDHFDLLDKIDTAYHDFSELDDRFHSAVIGIPRNRFIRDVQKLISLIFHYHYQWQQAPPAAAQREGDRGASRLHPRAEDPRPGRHRTGRARPSRHGAPNAPRLHRPRPPAVPAGSSAVGGPGRAAVTTSPEDGINAFEPPDRRGSRSCRRPWPSG